METFYRAIIDKDRDRFLDTLAILHPNKATQMLPMVLLCRIADKVQKLKCPDIFNLSFEERVSAVQEHRLSFQPYEAIAERFTKSEADVLWSRFGTLAARLKADAERSIVSDLPAGRFAYTDMPENFEVEDFIVSWND